VKIRVVLSTPDRLRFVCWAFGHRWEPSPTNDATKPRFTCRRCLAIGELQA
jgi:hypothetical protein